MPVMDLFENAFVNAPVIMCIINANREVERINRQASIFTKNSENNMSLELPGVVLNCVNATKENRCGLSNNCNNCPVRTRLEETLTSGKTFEREEGTMSLVRNDSIKRYNLLISTSVIDSNSMRILLSIEDITKIVDERREKNLHLELLDNINDFITATDLEGNITYVNKIVKKAFKNEKLKNISQLGHDSYWGATQEEILKKTLENEYWRTQVANIAPDGTKIMLDCRTKIIKDANDEPMGLVGISTDITQQKEFEKELIEAKERAEESDRLKTAFLHNLSHEIRTPLNGIMGFSQLLTTNRKLVESKFDFYAQLIKKNSKMLLNIIDDVLSMSSLDAGTLELKKDQIQCSELIKGIKANFEETAKDKGISLSVTLEKDFCFVSDEQKITQVLGNLVQNAIKFTSRGGVFIKASIVDNMIRFSVKDTGIGIKAEDQDRIFERFSQVEIGHARKYEGTGLGLAIAKGFIKLLKGEIHCVSSLGKGAEFIVELPGEECNIQPNSTKTEQNQQLHTQPSLNILIVEDQYSNYIYLQEILSYNDNNIVHVTSGEEAVKLVGLGHAFDYILMDVRLPVMSGLEATREIKKINRKLVIVMQTAYASYYDEQTALNCGADFFLEKPIEIEHLMAIINKQ
ncbi:MAG: hypothetical protein C0594_12205 [Marinilabiliales bacterium]|nr:MAG: hypothetical protein C0594_12205 [Marinilabiliales bacterium]